MSNDTPKGASVKRDGDAILIRIPIERAHALRVALSECPCKAPKSHATIATRAALSNAIATALAKGR